MHKIHRLWTGMLVGAFGISAVAFAGTESQRVVNIQEVRERIEKEHAGWQAKETWVSRLSRSEIRRMLGAQRPPQGQLEFEGTGIQASLPKSLDWRNVNGVNWLGPVMNQGNCGSCVAFSTVATLEARTSIAAGIPWLRPTFSPQELFACGGGGCDYGWLPEEAANHLQKNGVVDEACMPYTSGSTGDDVSCNSKCSDADSRAMKIASFTMPTSYGGSVDTVKKALSRGPLVTTLFVYADFVTYAGGVYKHVTGESLGGHAVSLVGYDDARRAWLIRNSWGTEWGENGFGWVSWDDRSGVGNDTWEFSLQPSQGYLTVSAPSDREYVSGTYQLQLQSQGASAQDAQFHLLDSQGKELKVIPCQNAKGAACTSSFDTTQLAEGRYQIYVQSQATPAIKSQIREFYVLNSEPVMNLSFAAASGTDLSKTLSGRPEFVVKAPFRSVPIQHIEFRVLDGSGKIVSTKANDYVLEEMKMGWRTVTVPNGQYTILFHGETKYSGKTYAVDSNSYKITVKN